MACIRADWTAPKAGFLHGRGRGQAWHGRSGQRHVLLSGGKMASPKIFTSSKIAICWRNCPRRPAGGIIDRMKRQKLGKDINYSEAGITVRETRDLWDMPVIFLLIAADADGGVDAAAQVGCHLRTLLAVFGVCWRRRVVSPCGRHLLPDRRRVSAANRNTTSASPAGPRISTRC